MAMVLALPIGQGSFAIAAASLSFVEEDRQRSHQREIPCGGGVAHLAVVFPLSVIAAVVLFGFDAPVASYQPQQSVRVGFLGVEASDPTASLAGGLDHLAAPQVVHLLVEAEDLRRSGQTEGGPIDRLAPELALFDPPMAFIGRLSLRGEDRPPGAVWLWRRPGVGCL